ncbi:hypothetical protein JMJ56_04010 [Belnapia sp. T18]|uniref:Uncharacterized protein n=1 Tax=Belnapia arida TaxID=2804533 RepID=A0ABS1TXI5_9PROT|nr:hypothetical protein [Belnapia arida]MBL6077158.1 hypothetical protein [Belnapia arida]
MRLPRPTARPARTGLVRGAAALGVIGAALAATWAWMGTASSPPHALPPPVAVAPAVPLLAEAELMALFPDRPTLLRLRENPRVFVLLFPSLAAQGAAMNRAAALVEKAGLPRDRLLDGVELAAAIARSGDTAETWYLGHDYRSADLARFLALAERDRVALTEAELWLRAQFVEALTLSGGEPFALVSVANPGGALDAAMRSAVLRHEIGHGHYFTLPGFTEHVQRVWRTGFSEAERAAYRAYLGREGYDTGNDELMANEAMAYTLFTPDPRLFSPALVGLPPAAVERLRELLHSGLALP